MDENFTLADCFADDCPLWLDKATAQERYNLSDRKWKKLVKNKDHISRYLNGDSLTFWEPDIKRKLECERTGEPYTESELLPLIKANCLEAANPLIFHQSIFIATLCILACWTVVPRYGFYNAGLTSWNIAIIAISAVGIFYSTSYGSGLYWRYRVRQLVKRQKQRQEEDANKDA